MKKRITTLITFGTLISLLVVFPQISAQKPNREWIVYIFTRDNINSELVEKCYRIYKETLGYMSPNLFIINLDDIERAPPHIKEKFNVYLRHLAETGESITEGKFPFAVSISLSGQRKIAEYFNSNWIYKLFHSPPRIGRVHFCPDAIDPDTISLIASIKQEVGEPGEEENEGTPIVIESEEEQASKGEEAPSEPSGPIIEELPIPPTEISKKELPDPIKKIIENMMPKQCNPLIPVETKAPPKTTTGSSQAPDIVVAGGRIGSGGGNWGVVHFDVMGDIFFPYNCVVRIHSYRILRGYFYGSITDILGHPVSTYSPATMRGGFFAKPKPDSQGIFEIEFQIKCYMDNEVVKEANVGGSITVIIDNGKVYYKSSSFEMTNRPTRHECSIGADWHIIPVLSLRK